MLYIITVTLGVLIIGTYIQRYPKNDMTDAIITILFLGFYTFCIWKSVKIAGEHGMRKDIAFAVALFTNWIGLVIYAVLDYHLKKRQVRPPQ